MKSGRSRHVSFDPGSPASNIFQTTAPIRMPWINPASANTAASGFCIAPAFIANQQRRAAAGQGDQQTFLKPWIIAGEVGHVRRLLAIAIKHQRIMPGRRPGREGCGNPGLIKLPDRTRCTVGSPNAGRVASIRIGLAIVVPKREFFYIKLCVPLARAAICRHTGPIYPREKTPWRAYPI
jgi:hypothetical protein